MDSIIEIFHLDWQLLLGQMLNFAIVLGLLYWFVFKPLFKTVDARNLQIEKGLKDAEESAAKLKLAADEKLEIINEARRESARILKEAHDHAESKKAEAVKEAKQEIAKIIEKEKQNIHQEKAVILSEIRQEAAVLVAEAAGKLVGQKMDAELNKEMINKALG